MRRIKFQVIKNIEWNYPLKSEKPSAPFDAVLMERSDYALMRAVVKAAEQSLRDPHFRGVFASSVLRSVTAFNAPKAAP